MRKLAVLAVAIIVLATIGASYQLSANLVKTSNVVKIGYIPLALSLHVFVAEENGYFGSEGVKYGLVEMESTDSIKNGNTFLGNSSAVTKERVSIFLRLLAPFAPHITEELW